MNWLLNRLKEKSTWLAIFTLVGLAGIQIEPEFRDLIIDTILGAASVAAFVYRENTSERSTDPKQPEIPEIDLQSRSDPSGRGFNDQ